MSHILLPDFVVPETRTLGEFTERVRENAPLVQCLTNAVVTGFTANVLLAAGASPAMVDIRGEADLFARVAGGVLVNVGTPHAEPRDAMIDAARAAHEHGTPWVLDPVAVGALPVRTELSHALLRFRPTAIRGNASEVLALAGHAGGGRGTDAVDTVDDALDAARALAGEFGSVVCVSGPEDLIVSPDGEVRVNNGSPILTKVTGGGCALGAVLAAYLAVASSDEYVTAAVAAHATYGIAAGWAHNACEGPGSFAMHFLDALSLMTSSVVADEARVGK